MNLEPAMLAQGTVVDRYAVEGRIGEGGMAVVYKVRHTTLGTVHALKVLTVSSPGLRARLQTEGQLQASLRHPNLVAVTDVVDVGGAQGLILEYIDGPSLDTLLRTRKLTLAEIDALVPGILAGVALAHQHGVVHRDLKPANVLLQRTDAGLVPKVADFGLAKAVDGSDAGGRARTRTGSAMGTPHYMSPEQVRDAKHVGPATDVFAVGAILYEMVTGRRAFDGPDLLMIFNRVAHGEYVPVRDLVPDAPDRVVNTIASALSVDPAARPASMAALAEAWGVALPASSASSLEPGAAPIRWEAPTTTTYAPEPTVSTVDPPRSGASIRRGAVVLGVGGGVLAMGTLAVLLLAAIGIGLAVLASRPTTVMVPVVAAGGGGRAGAASAEVPEVPLDPTGPEVPVPAPKPPPGKTAVPPPADAAAVDPFPEGVGPDPLAVEVIGPQDGAAQSAALETPPPPLPAEPAAGSMSGSDPAPPDPPEAFGMLASDDPEERKVAAENLGKRITDPDAVPLLDNLVRKDPDAEVRRFALGLVVDRYLDGVRDLEPTVVWAMSHMDEARAVPAIEAYRAKGADPRALAGPLGHSDPDVRLAALKALPVVAPRTPDSVSVRYDTLLAKVLSDPDPAVAKRAREVAATLGL